ncbi:Serine/threonine-protein kinase PknK [Mycobacterium marinum]|nr:protein kinase [Mycobacterium marinum]AXN45552.1 Serine/threonine-protein kinase PknK [Mycobacterium marinum]AXN50828.1 Serine/threonine-protein kinase PknK [Mycobacterium marinum]EPQ75040.1 serine/threonine protein kinase [Mycobacterium marinum str. Europe]RFZ06982.1 Serine/threonine-protein kinase PknK [Mycobacterium marinum]RFZ10804.1 Serine/threonine-protein kinase PknK [Mycobacterium marinum]
MTGTDAGGHPSDPAVTENESYGVQHRLQGPHRNSTSSTGEVGEFSGITITNAVPELADLGFVDAYEVGRGGYGVVYRCVQAELGRVVAVKTLTADVDEWGPRFLREEQAMARLTAHPNIVPVLQVGQTAGGLPFLVMPFCGRGSVQQRIERYGVLAVEEMLRIGVKIAAALESAHRVGVVHRDVKPANVLLTDYGEPALCDFGIARMEAGFETGPGMFVGSPAYTAPELLAGESPNAASDVYALGASLFAGLTGHAAFERRNGEQVVAQFLRIANESIPDLRDNNIPTQVADLVNAAMAREPGDRPSALKLGEMIQQAQADLGLAVDAMALPEANGEEGIRSARRIPTGARSGAERYGPGRVPVLPAGLVGRRDELAQLRKSLYSSRLVTVTGMGGVGKTTLAIAAAGQLRAEFSDQVWLVELSELRDGDMLAEVAIAALGVCDQTGAPPTDVLVEFLGHGMTLLVIDNCEQIIDAVAKQVDNLLHHCPQLHILATSREVLDIDGESVLPLMPLAVPETDADSTLGSLARYDAVELFVARARAGVPEFRLTHANAAAVARVCARLDGLPLAIELAAARLRALSIEQIADGLADRYHLLSRGHRGAPTRQQNLVSCVAWSHDLCTPTEQHLWAILSVFAGSFDLPAARHVSAGSLLDEQCLDVMCTLVDKSILIRTEHDGQVRFRLLDTLRDYGRTHLSAAEHHQLRHRHADYYHRLAAQAYSDWFGPQQIEWLSRLTAETPNLREALQFCITHEPATALELAANLREIWIPRGMFSEGYRWLDLALTALPPLPSPERIRALAHISEFANFRGNLPRATELVAQARQLYESLADRRVIAVLECTDGHMAMINGDFERARDCLRRAASATDDLQSKGCAMLLMGWDSLFWGDVEKASDWFEKALAVSESHGESLQRSYVLVCTGISSWRRGEFERAEQQLQQGIQICRALNDRWMAAQYFEALAWCAGSNEDFRRAVVLMAAANVLSPATGFPLMALFSGLHDECEQRSRAGLDDAEYQAAWNQGSALSFQQAVMVAVGE